MSRSSGRAVPESLVLLTTLLLLLLAAPPLAATSYLPMSDAELVASADVAAVVRVVDRLPAPLGPLPSSRYLVEVEEVLMGHLPAGRVELRVPGGRAADGSVWKVYAAPHWTPGERALLFLHRRADGSYGISQLMLGAFHLVEHDGARYAVRDLRGALALGAVGQGDAEAAPRETARRFEAFARWVEDRAAGGERPADYHTALPAEALLAEAAGGDRAHGRYVLFDDQNQCPGAPLPIRWFTFDGGGAVSWRMHASGQPGMGGNPPGVAEFQSALALWNGDAGSHVHLSFAGTTGATSPTSTGTGVIAFDDPDGEIDGSFGGSGTVAVGGPFFSCDPRSYRGTSYRQAVRGFIVTQDGAASFFSGHGGADGEEVFAHELGHTLGFSHTGVPGSLMRSFAYGDGRGAFLGSDERQALAEVYGQGASGGGGGGVGGGGGGGTPTPTRPAAPSQLTASVLAPTQVRLRWHDASDDESEFRVQVRMNGLWQEIGSVGADATAVTVSDLDPATAYVFRVRACNQVGCSGYSNEAAVTTPPAQKLSCSDPDVLCLHDGRFAVQVAWRNQRNGAAGTGTAVPNSDRSGFFWFFNAANVELVVKVLDGRAVNGRFWVFYGALSDVGYDVVITDRETGVVRSYTNPPGEICGRSDTMAFPAATNGAAAPLAAGPTVAAAGVPSAGPLAAVAERAVAAGGVCAAGEDALCLQDGRFEVTVDWRNQRAGGASGVGQVAPTAVGGDTTGFFWFFNPANVELVVKVIDGRQVNGHHWVFYGALSDVEYEIRVRDTVTGTRRSYTNEPGNICGLSDTTAF